MQTISAPDRDDKADFCKCFKIQDPLGAGIQQGQESPEPEGGMEIEHPQNKSGPLSLGKAWRPGEFRTNTRRFRRVQRRLVSHSPLKTVGQPKEHNFSLLPEIWSVSKP
jgi:hypothetical protein